MAASPKSPPTLHDIVAKPALADKLSVAQLAALLGVCEAGRAVVTAALAIRVQQRSALSDGSGHLLSAAELADALGVKASLVKRKARAGEIPFVAVGRYPRFNLTEVEAALRDAPKTEEE